MEEYDDDERKCKVKEKLNEGGSENIEKLKDEKVLKKQIDWFEEKVRYGEMKKKYSEEKEKTDMKRKRQLSSGKKKNQKLRKKKKF